jgi:hypothetical protein
MRATMILCDNQRCIKMIENHVFHERSKHIEIPYHFIRKMVQRGALKLQYINMDEQVADVLTKPLYCPLDAIDDADLSRLMLLKKTLLVKGEC